MSGLQLSDFELYVFPGECLFVKIAQASARALGQEVSLRNNNGTAALELVPADHLQLHHEATHCNLDGSRLERQLESWESEPLCSAVEPRTARLGF